MKTKSKAQTEAETNRNTEELCDKSNKKINKTKELVIVKTMAT